MRIGLLGAFEVRADDGVPLDVPGARLRGLLVGLALEAGHVVPKGTLVDWIWGEQPPADATNALHRLVSRLRKVLPEGAVEGLTDGYRLVVDPDDVDAVRFERLVRDGDLTALGLWRGAAMQDVGLPESAAFEAAVTRLEELRLNAYESAEAGAGQVAELTALVAAHPVRERLVAALMRALGAAGRGNEALLVYQRTREALADTLGVDPSAELSAVHVALLRGELGRREEPRRTNLRAELTSYVGKDTEVTAVRGLVDGSRLTTLIGPGGSGKTRLATETARTLLDGFPDGVWLVELAAIGADGDVAQATLAALGQRDALLGDLPDAEPVERVVAAIRDRGILLILDNCEHVIEAAAAFAHRVLGECRRLRILATSREPLGITGETLWPVVPLVLGPAVRLLQDRAGAVRKDLGTDARTLATMERVCRALDGMPLAIELAAARLRTLSLEQLANRLDDRFRLLTGGSRTALPRHRTLRAVIDWSWELLSDDERVVLRRLSVFAGGASLEAAERVCGSEELLTALTEKSLVVTGGEDTPRYRMLGTIREYAQQRLAEAGEAELTRHAHLEYFTELAETAEPHLRRADQLEWQAVLEAEHDNIAAAMRGALAAGEARGAVRLAAAAGWYWWFGGHKVEGNELIRAAVDLPGESDDEALAVAYAFVVLFLGSGRGDQFVTEDWIRRGYEIGLRVRGGHPALRFLPALRHLLEAAEPSAFEPLLTDDDPWVRALARLQLGKLWMALGRDARDADTQLETALAEFRAIGDRWGISFALTELAERFALRGDLAGACERLEQAIAVVTEAGAIEDVVSMRPRQAKLHWLAGDLRASAAAMAEAQRHAEGVAWPNALAELALARAELATWDGDAGEARHQLGLATAMLGDKAAEPNVRAITHGLLGYLAEDPAESREHRVEALRAATESAQAPLIAGALVGVADWALRAGRDEQAARLLGASTAVLGMPDRSQPYPARIERETRERLGDQRFTEALAEGAGSSWPELAEVTLAS
ncbi:BTAD domain-containing putative transcriptional regulator [Actinoplanes regularis]|uniref:Predicted ATPase n=1 Tax=Actinoplanes regularis TaxID=52697 RepID=A0A238W1S3_9ACTN|nr:BTAD domain-containing putative transcriptional regulator [Actinoplanes regularis]GIE85335.1 SARP family transcriptional regulator [Actinoplanes regularis]SNR40555.1 Predicted ATPase [Actinoplanes regularis]